MLCIPLCFSVTEAMADEHEDEFTHLMNEGIAYYKAGASDPSQYQKAIVAFEKAKLIQAHPDITYNIARCYHMMGNCNLALVYYREYAIGSVENAEKVKDKIDELVEICGRRKAKLDIKCIPENAMVSIDRAEIVPCNDVFEVNAGEHIVTVTADNYSAETRTIDAKTGKNPTSVVFDLHAASGAGASSKQSVVVPDDSSDRLTASSQVQNVTTQTSSRVMTQDAPDNSVRLDNVGPLFWTGVGAAGGGLLFSIIGISLVGTAHKAVVFNDFDAYERNDSKLAAGGVLTGLGITALAGGATLLILERLGIIGHNGNSQASLVVPAVSVSSQDVSASLSFSF